VVNYDFGTAGDAVESYVHRIGRTARGGQEVQKKNHYLCFSYGLRKLELPPLLLLLFSPPLTTPGNSTPATTTM
jgi:hypothetical protein